MMRPAPTNRFATANWGVCPLSHASRIVNATTAQRAMVKRSVETIDVFGVNQWFVMMISNARLMYALTARTKTHAANTYRFTDGALAENCVQQKRVAVNDLHASETTIATMAHTAMVQKPAMSTEPCVYRGLDLRLMMKSPAPSMSAVMNLRWSFIDLLSPDAPTVNSAMAPRFVTHRTAACRAHRPICPMALAALSMNAMKTLT